MADCASLPSCAHPRLQRIQVKANCPAPRVLLSGKWERNLIYGKHKLVDSFLLQKLYTVYYSPCASLKGGHNLKWNNMRCHCFGMLTNPESLTPSNWVPMIDQVLLTVSIVLAYMAGAVPYRKPLFNARKRAVAQKIGAEDSTASERQREDH